MPSIRLKQKYLILLGCAAACCGLGIAEASARSPGIYFAGYLGLSHFGSEDFSDGNAGTSGSFKTRSTPNFAGALGLRVNENIRLEGELSYRKLKIDGLDIAGLGSFDSGGDMKSWTGLLNVYYDFNTHSKFTPYLSGGVGFSRVSGALSGVGGSPSFMEEEYGFTWQAGAGLKYRASDKTSYTLGYRYMDTPGLEMGGVDVNHGGHEFRIGLQYNFD